MSGKPSTENVAELRAVVARLGVIDAEVDRLRKQMDTLKASFDTLTIERVSKRDRAIKLLDSMDCSRSGNTGFEARILWMLTELASQSEHFGRTHT